MVLKNKDFSQVCNPKTKRFIKINKRLGQIVSHKRSPGPYKNIFIAGRRYDLE